MGIVLLHSIDTNEEIYLVMDHVVSFQKHNDGTRIFTDDGRYWTVSECVAEVDKFFL